MVDGDPPETVYGVDFSAARRDAGRDTWIAECTPTGDGLVVDELADAAEFLGCSPDRDSTLAALVELLTERTDERRAFGLDFPFGLPCSMLGESDWHAFVASTGDGEWGLLGEIDGPRSLYDAAEEQGGSLRRQTDSERAGQKPSGFRIKTQTYYGISGVLAAVADDVSVVPMDEPAEARETVVLEIYPAAVFRRLRGRSDTEVHDAGYRRDTREAIERRRDNAEALRDRGVELGDHFPFAAATEHALDAVAAAVGTWRAGECAYLPDDLVTESGDVESPYAVEGYIYR